MTQLTWPTPSTGPITMVSPSAINAYQHCPRRLAYQRDPATRGLSKPSLRTALGTVAHSLHETAATKQPPPGQERRDWLAAEWERLLSEQVDKITDAWSGRAVPPVSQWDGLVATRVRTIRRLATHLAPEPAANDPRAGPGFPWFERRLKDPGTGIFGTPDRVEIRDGQLRVVDLKSGVHQADIRDSQRRQLLLYAHLVDVACNQLPAVGVIETARGSETTFPIDSIAVTNALDEAQQSVASYNAAVATGDVPAHPAEGACRNCAFRTVCGPYWASQAKSDRDVRGTVTDVEPRSFTVDVGTGEVVRVVSVMGSRSPSLGDEVVALDLLPAGPGTMKMRWNSAIRLPAAAS